MEGEVWDCGKEVKCVWACGEVSCWESGYDC